MEPPQKSDPSKISPKGRLALAQCSQTLIAVVEYFSEKLLHALVESRVLRARGFLPFGEVRWGQKSDN